MTKKRPPQKKTAPTDELNILAVQPSTQKVAPDDVQQSAASIENLLMMPHQPLCQ
jgi:hypothetical protein